MNLTIFSFQRAFTATQRMALAAGNCSTTLAAIEAKDILDSLYLGLDCEVTDCGEFCDASSSVDEFISHCKTILQKLANAEHYFVTIPLSNDANLSLTEKNGNLHMKMDGQQVTLANLTIQHLYKKLVRDIQTNSALYGMHLSTYASGLKRDKKIPALLLPTL